MLNVIISNICRKALLLSVIFLLCHNSAFADILSSFENRTVIIEGDSNFPPFEYIDSNGNKKGFNVDLIEAIMSDLELDYEFNLREWDDVISRFEGGKTDVISGITHTNRWANIMGLGIPYHKVSLVMLTRKNDKKFTKISELKNRKIIVQNKGWGHSYLFNNNITDSLFFVDDIAEGIKLLKKGGYDAVVATDIVAHYTLHENKFENIVITNANVEPQGFSFAVSDNDEALLYLLNKGLYELKVDGTYDKIYDKWFGIYEKPKISKFVYLGLFVTLGVLLLAFVFIYMMKRQIYNATSKVRTLNNELDLVLKAGKISAWIFNVEKRVFHSLYGETFVGSGSAEGMTFDEFMTYIHDDDLPFIRTLFENLITKRVTTASGIIRCRNLSDKYEYVYYESEMVMAKDEKGVDHIVGTQRDITEDSLRTDTIERLYRENEVILRALPVGVAIYDKHGCQQYINEAVANIFGVTDIDAHIEKHILFYDDPVVPDYVKNKIRMGEDVNMDLEYNLKKALDTGYFSTDFSHKMYLSCKARSIIDEKGNIDRFVLIMNDITEKRIHELKIERSELNLKLALEAGEVNVCYYDVNNKCFNVLYGSQFIDNDTTMEQFSQMLCPDYREEFNRMYDDILSEKIKNAYSIMKFKGSGDEVLYIENRVMAVYSKEGNMETVIGTYKDITRIYKYQKELEDSMRKTELAIIASELILWDYDCETGETFIVKDSLKEGKTSSKKGEYYEIIHPDDFEKVLEIEEFMDTKEHRDKFNVDLRLKMQDKENWQYVTINGAPVEYDRHGNVSRYLGVMRNNTKWIELNEKLKKLNEQNSLVLDNTNSGFVYLSSDYVVQWENISYNHINCRDECWYTVGSVCYKNLNRNTACEDCPASKAALSLEVETKEFINSDGSTYEMFATPVVKNGVLQGIVLRIDNISERKLIYNELQEAKNSAERSDRLKSAFLANMSHEIRTPLNAIVGFSELLMDRDSDNDEDREQYLKIINLNNDLLLKLINDILDLSKIEAGFMELKYTKFDLAAYFEDMTITLRQRVTNSDITLVCDNNYYSCLVEFDKSRLTQVITNFVTNSIKFTSSGEIRMGYRVEENGVKVYVSDTGIGIAEDKIDRVFDRFEKLNDFAQGTGLGMAICKAIMDACGGKIGVESSENRGTTFWIWIPCKYENVVEK